MTDSRRLLENAALLNGVNQTQYIIRSPLFYPDVPEPAFLAALTAQQGGADTKARYQVDSGLRAPYMIQAAVGVERQLPHGLSVALNYQSTRGDHQLLARDINAPLPTVFNSLGRQSALAPLAQHPATLPIRGQRYFPPKPGNRFGERQNQQQIFAVRLLCLESRNERYRWARYHALEPLRSAERL